MGGKDSTPSMRGRPGEDATKPKYERQAKQVNRRDKFPEAKREEKHG